MGQPFDPSRQHPQQQYPPAGWQPGYPDPADQQPGYPTSGQQQQDPARVRASGRTGRSGPLLAGLAAGLVVAVVVGAILAVVGALHVGTDTSARVSSAPITLPSSLPGLQDYLTVSTALMKKSSRTTEQQATLIAKQQANADKVSSQTRDAYQKANPGAAVAFKRYADPTLERLITVIAVRASYPGLTNGQVIDPADLGLAVAQQRIESFGDVQCLLVQTQLTPAGTQPDPKNQITTLCQRSGPALTVQIYAGGGFTGNDGRQNLVDLTNSTFASIAG